MDSNKINGKVNIAVLGNYTRGAVKEFENNIVSETNYLEKVDRNLKEDNK